MATETVPKPVDPRTLAVLSEITSVCHSAIGVAVDGDENSLHVLELLFRHIGALADSARAIEGSGPVHTGNHVDWMVPFLKEEANHG